ncbi:MAG: zinc-ribbon domain-containing protein [Culturomica sp.]|jgi:hypothetical protein|nr:zinc-ribbon domain-containing protein [Culturomica sp.]
MAIKCKNPKCGAENPDDAKVCSKCGQVFLSDTQEELAFFKKNKESISSCEAYLQKYPKGKFVKEVQLLLVRKKKSRKTRIVIFIVLLLIAASIFAYSNYFPVSFIKVDNNVVELNNLGSEISLNIETDANSSTIYADTSEDWINCRVSGTTLYISGNTNPNNERSATVTLTAHSSFFGRELSHKEQAIITVSQETGYATYLSVTNDDVFLSANGGKESITISTDGIFAVSTAPASWVTTSINGKTLNLEYSENSGTVRNSYLIVKSGTKSKRLDITQAGKLATRLDVSTTEASFNADGGSRTITVSTDGEWKISTGTNTWGHTSINGNTITLRVDANNGYRRTGYFIVKSGSIEKKIEISQDGTLATYLRLSKSSINASRDGTGYNEYYVVNVETDGDNVTATTSAYWIDVNVVSGNRIEIETSENTGSKRTATITVKADEKSKQIKVSQKGISICPICFGSGRVMGVIGYVYYEWGPTPQPGWVECPNCDGSGHIED